MSGKILLIQADDRGAEGLRRPLTEAEVHGALETLDRLVADPAAFLAGPPAGAAPDAGDESAREIESRIDALLTGRETAIGGQVERTLPPSDLELALAGEPVAPVFGMPGTAMESDPASAERTLPPSELELALAEDGPSGSRAWIGGAVAVAILIAGAALVYWPRSGDPRPPVERRAEPDSGSTSADRVSAPTRTATLEIVGPAEAPPEVGPDVPPALVEATIPAELLPPQSPPAKAVEILKPAPESTTAKASQATPAPAAAETLQAAAPPPPARTSRTAAESASAEVSPAPPAAAKASIVERTEPPAAAVPPDAPAATPAPVVPSTAGAPPSPLQRVEPVFSREDVREQRGRHIVLRLLVDEQGIPVRVLIKDGVPGSAAVAKAIDAALRTRYAPALERGKPVSAWVIEAYELTTGEATGE